MKVFYFLPKLVNCGPANVVLNNIREITQLQSNVTIAMISYRENTESNDFRVSCENLGVKEFYTLGNQRCFFQKYLYLKEITRKADVIHSNGFFPDLYTSILPSNIVKISTVHSIISKDYPATYGTYRGSIYAILHHLVYLNPSFDNIAACSYAVERHIKSYSVFNKMKNKMCTIHNGINLNNFSKLNLHHKISVKNEAFKSLGIRTDDGLRVFVYSGRLTRLKRVPELIEWFLKLSNNNILIILGDGEERQLCEKIAKDATNIHFLGHVSNPTRYYQIADYVVSNSSLEGFPMGVLEGMSCGCIALLSDISAHREIVEYFPNMASLFPAFELNPIITSPSEIELFYLSATRMTNQYLTIYTKNFKLKAASRRID